MSAKNINLKEDSIFQLFIRVAVPSSIGTIFQNLYTVADSIFAGQMISTTALAAIGQVFPIYFVIIALGIGLSIGSTSLIANNLGKSDGKKASKIFGQTIILTIIISLIVSLLGIYFSPKIINSINSDKETLFYSLEYINIIFIGSVFIFLLMTLNSALNAQGDTKSYRNVLIFSFFLNIILNPILISGKILGINLFSPLGISGIAIATVISQFIGIFYLFYKIKKTKIYNSLKKNYLIPNFTIIKNILTQGIPASIGLMMIAIGSYIILYFVAMFGKDAIAGYTAALRYEQLFFLPLLGLSTAVISIVGQNYGGKKFDRIKETYNKALLIGIIILIVLSIIIFYTSEVAMKIFTSKKEVIEFGSICLKINALGLPALPFFFIGNATFQGLKKAIIVMFMAILRFVLIPLFFLSFLFIYYQKDYNLIFIILLIMNWSIGLLYYIYCRYKINSILS